MSYLTSRSQISAITLDDVFHIVDVSDTSQNPAGSSYKGSVQQLIDVFDGNYVHISGDTMTGPLIVPTISATTISGGTLYGDGSNLTGISGSIFTGGTVTGPTDFTNGLTANTISATTISADTIYPTHISNVNYIDFNTGYNNGSVPGRLAWSSDDGTLELGMTGGTVVQQIGEEIFYFIKNQSGATIENGRVVRAAGTLGASGRILGEYMIADGSIPPKFTLGIATEDILNGNNGYVTEFGLVRGINTTGALYGETWNDGDILWVSPTIPGGLTKVQPEPPNYKIEVAIVVLASVNGSIFVRPHRLPHIHDLQDVAYSADTETNLDILQWDSTISGFTITNTPQFVSVSATTISATTFVGPFTSSIYKTEIVTGGTSYTFTDFAIVNTISLNKTSGSTTTVILNQTPSTNDFYVVKDRKGDTDIYPITISGGTYNIDGNATIIINTPKTSLTFLFDGDEYILI